MSSLTTKRKYWVSPQETPYEFLDKLQDKQPKQSQTGRLQGKPTLSKAVKNYSLYIFFILLIVLYIQHEQHNTL